MSDSKTHQSAIGDLVIYKPRGSFSFIPCFAIVVGLDFFNEHVSYKMQKILEIDQRQDRVFLFRIGKESNLDGEAEFSLGYAVPSWCEIDFICSVFDKEKFINFLDAMKHVNVVFSLEPNRQVSFVYKIFSLLERVMLDLQNTQQGNTLYGQLLVHLQENKKDK